MSKAARVRVTKVRQQHRAEKRMRAGQPYNGPNLVAQHGASSKKAARKSSRHSQATPLK